MVDVVRLTQENGSTSYVEVVKMLSERLGKWPIVKAEMTGEKQLTTEWIHYSTMEKSAEEVAN